LAHSQIHSKVVNDGQFLPLDNLAYDAGIPLNEADHNLRNALSRFKTGLPDLALFASLPELYGLVYISPRWKTSQYSIEYEGFLNNIHCTAMAIRYLMSTFNRVTLKETGQGNQVDIEKRIQLDFERFIKCSAYSILHMHTDNNDQEYKQGVKHEINHNIVCPMAFLELFILSSGGRLQVQVLESCLPFTLLRTNYIQLYEKQAGEDFTFAAVADDEKE